MQVHAQQQGVVVEHLLEMRHDPGVVNGVASKAARQLVIHAPARHRFQSLLGHQKGLGASGSRGFAQQELEHH